MPRCMPPPGIDVGVDPLPVVRQDLDVRVVVACNSDEDAGIRARQQVRGLTAIFESLPYHFEEEALLRIHVTDLARRDAEEIGVELVDSFDETAPARVNLAQRGGIGIVERFDIEALRRQLRDGVNAVAQELPELGRRVGAAREPAADSYDGNGLAPQHVVHAK